MGKRDAKRGDKNEWRRRWKSEIYSVIETVMGFVRSTCQGQVKTILVREEERDERMGGERRGQLESGSRWGETLVHANLTWLPICASLQTSNANTSHKHTHKCHWLESANQLKAPIHIQSHTCANPRWQPTYAGWLDTSRHLTRCPRCSPKLCDWEIKLPLLNI